MEAVISSPHCVLVQFVLVAHVSNQADQIPFETKGGMFEYFFLKLFTLHVLEMLAVLRYFLSEESSAVMRKKVEAII